MTKSLLLAAVAMALTQPLSAFPAGAPISSCKNLEPEHTSPTTCGRNCPFKITLIEIDNKTVSNPNTYRCGAVHKLRLQTNGDAIKGFVVQARQAASGTAEFDNRAPYVGRFVSGGSNWKLWACDAPSATHRSNSDKMSIDLMWRAPDTPSPQSVVFWYTVVNDFAEYYVRLKGPQLSAACGSVESAASAPAAREKSLQCTSNLRGVTLSVNCNPATSSAACRINGEPPSLCTFPLSKDVSQLSAGNHRLVISTPDISVPTVINFTIPDSLSLSCKGVTDDFSFIVNCNSSTPLRTVLCAVDDFPPRSCTLPFKRLINPTSPTRSVSVFATGTNGVGATAIVELVRLNLKCEAEVDRGMTVTVTCSSNVPIATAQCTLDDEPANSCIVPNTMDISALMPGSHRILVSAATENGSSASTIANFNVPVTAVIGTLKCEGDVTNSVLTITCDSPNEITNLQCSLDQSEAQPCIVPYRTDLTALSPGEHTFSASIIGTDGVAANQTYRFTIAAPMTNSTFNDACSSLLPEDTMESSECEEGCPYTLSLVRINGRAVSNVFTYRCGATYTVSVSSREDPFTEVAVQARASSALFDIEAPFVGQFVNGAGTQSCGTGVALQTSESPKKNAQMTWQAPKEMTSDVTFWYSIKTIEKTFVQLRGPTLGPDPRSCTARN
ncbi:hypothetical protein EMCRGX_G012002 [Ephydatia muelleri]